MGYECTRYAALGPLTQGLSPPRVNVCKVSPVLLQRCAPQCPELHTVSAGAQAQAGVGRGDHRTTRRSFAETLGALPTASRAYPYPYPYPPPPTPTPYPDPYLILTPQPQAPLVS